MRLGIDLGGTKTEIVALDGAREVLRRRISTPRDYDGTLAGIAGLVRESGMEAPVGVAIPGTETPDGTVKNANSTWLNGRPLRADLERATGRKIRLANDANCFALSEATDGAGAGAAVVFGVIAGTGVGGGIVIDGKVKGGAHGVGGEWGHIPLPGMNAAELAEAPACYCGKRGCLEVWCSGPGVAAEFERATGRKSTADQIAASDGTDERAAMARHADRLARGLATVCNIIDPDVIVLGGGLSNIASLYEALPPLVEKYGFTYGAPPRIVKNRHGDSSGVRGAAWLWPA
ncbi:MAG TPA: ROK family protein [Rhizomicrobium sp.]|nr:ROK family protein [Rhizomicrobium sp.]